MARTNSTNFTGVLQYPIADAATDLFKKEDVQVATKALDLHDHTAGKGLPIPAGAIPNGLITSAMIANGTIVAADIAAGTITSNEIADGGIATVDLANAAVTNAKLASDTARANLLTNGGFEIWQRGNGPFTAAGAACTDRWFIELAGTDTHSVSRDTTNIDSANGSRTAAACTVTKGTGGADLTKLTQTLKSSEYDLINRTLSASVRVRTATANAVRLGLFDGSAFSFSPYHPGGGTWQTLTVSVTMTAGATLTQIAVVFNLSCTAYIDNAMLVVGSVPADYAPLHPADDLARCLRYYEKVSNNVTSGYAVSATLLRAPMRWEVTKAITPTITFPALASVIINSSIAATSITAGNTSLDSTGLDVGTTGAVAGNAWVLSLNAPATIEANP